MDRRDFFKTSFATVAIGGLVSPNGFAKDNIDKKDVNQDIYMPYRLLTERSLVNKMTYQQAVARIPDRELPEFWMVEDERIKIFLSELEKGEVRKLTQSAGKRDIFVVTYGEKEQTNRLANFNSAIAAKEPNLYSDKASRKKPVIFLLGPVHGHEVEGIVGLINLMNIIERGKDLRGRDYRQLQKRAEKFRLVIVPVGNPDGLARFAPKTLQGMEFEDLRFWGQGTWSDDVLCGWPSVKRQHPMVGENVGFLGCYMNDDGINAMHDEFFNPMSSEVKAFLDLAREEAPDIFASLHSYNVPAGLLCPAYVPKEMKTKVVEDLADLYDEKLAAYNLTSSRFGLVKEEGEIPPSFNLVSAIYHVSGALVFTHESPHGTNRIGVSEWKVFSLEEILDIQLALYEAILEYALR